VNNLFQMGVEERLSATECDNRSAQCSELIDTLEHLIEDDRLGKVVKLVAVGAGKIAPSDWNQMRQDGVVLGGKPFGNHAQFTQARINKSKFSPQSKVH
jgi:hypothetical protein